ncbi:hypothetical protein V6N13_072324 [Hibiscus sabdariffa]
MEWDASFSLFLNARCLTHADRTPSFMGLSPQCLLSLLVDGGLGRKQGRSDGGTVTNERIKQCRRTYDDEVERGDVGKLRANKLHSGQFASLASLYGMTGLTSGKFLWPKEKSWVLYRTKQAVIGLSFSPGKLPRASFPGREESTERLVNPYGNADKEKETEAAGPDRQRKPSTKCNLQRQRSKMHENELPANYGRYRRFTSRIHREHGIATPLINNKAIAWLQAASPRSVEPAASPSPPPGQDGTSCKIRILPSSQPALRQLEMEARDILAKALYISKKGDFNGSDGSLTGVPENVIDKWAFETRFVATRGFPSRLSCPVQSVVLLSEAKANLLYCIRSSWLLGCGRPVVFLPYKNAYYIVLEASPAASKTRFVDKARSVLDLR